MLNTDSSHERGLTHTFLLLVWRKYNNKYHRWRKKERKISIFGIRQTMVYPKKVSSVGIVGGGHTHTHARTMIVHSIYNMQHNTIIISLLLRPVLCHHPKWRPSAYFCSNFFPSFPFFFLFCSIFVFAEEQNHIIFPLFFGLFRSGGNFSSSSRGSLVFALCLPLAISVCLWLSLSFSGYRCLSLSFSVFFLSFSLTSCWPLARSTIKFTIFLYFLSSCHGLTETPTTTKNRKSERNKQKIDSAALITIFCCRCNWTKDALYRMLSKMGKTINEQEKCCSRNK